VSTDSIIDPIDILSEEEAKAKLKASEVADYIYDLLAFDGD